MSSVPYYHSTIDLKPSSELLSDEYERQNNKQLIVQIIYGNEYAAQANEFDQTMRACGFTIRKDQFQNYSRILEALTEAVRKQRKNAGVFLIVLCNAREDAPGHLISDEGVQISFKDFWEGFIKMDDLNRQPKLFLFHTYLPEPNVCFDVARNTFRANRLFDVAAPGADLFVIYRTIERGNRDIFIKNFCKKVETDGEHQDIFDIATLSVDIERPLILSTLTAKFYFKSSTFGNHRNYNYLIQKGLQEILEPLESVVV